MYSNAMPPVCYRGSIARQDSTIRRRVAKTPQVVCYLMPEVRLLALLFGFQAQHRPNSFLSQADSAASSLAGVSGAEWMRTNCNNA